MRAPRGFTLAELLAWMGLSGLLLLILVNLVIPALRLSARTQARLELSQMALKLARQLQKDVESSAPSALRFVAPTLVLQRVEGLAADGSRLGSGNWTIYHREAATRVVWRQLAPLDPPSAAALRLPSPAQLATLLAAPGAERRVLAVNASDLTLEFLPESSPPALRLVILLEAPVPGRPEPERVVWEETLRLPAGDA